MNKDTKARHKYMLKQKQDITFSIRQNDGYRTQTIPFGYQPRISKKPKVANKRQGGE